MTQFIAHAQEPRTFSTKKGAFAAIKRDLAKTPEAINAAGYDVQPSGDRFGVIVYLDLTQKEAEDQVTTDLAGYVIEPMMKDTAPAKSGKPGRRAGEVNVTPFENLIPCRAGSKQQALVDALWKGATMDDLRAICVRRDGTPWDDSSIRSAFYEDMKKKGYGVKTSWNGETPTYHLVLPAGYDTPLAPTARKS